MFVSHMSACDTFNKSSGLAAPCATLTISALPLVMMHRRPYEFFLMDSDKLSVTGTTEAGLAGLLKSGYNIQACSE